MGNNDPKMVISKAAWKKMPVEEQTFIIYDTVQSHDKRITKLENRGFVYKTVAFVGGVIGGAAAVFGLKISGMK